MHCLSLCIRYKRLDLIMARLATAIRMLCVDGIVGWTAAYAWNAAFACHIYTFLPHIIQASTPKVFVVAEIQV